jgi:hypothetical protein
MNDEERAYNLEEFAASAPTPLNPGVTMAAKVGVAAPDFEAPMLDGQWLGCVIFAASATSS